MLEDQRFCCPYCGEPITVTLDLSVHEQRYVEDCEVCCRPIEIHIGVADGAVSFFEAKRGDD